MKTVLVVDDKQMMRDSVCAVLQRGGMAPIAAESGPAALELLKRRKPDAVITDLKMPEMDGIELLKRVLALSPEIPVVLMTAYATVDTAVDALKCGAADYIQKPFESEELVAVLRRAMDRPKPLNGGMGSAQGGDVHTVQRALIGDSPAMLAVRQQIQQIASSHGTVLITGESGTGKEVVAHMLHELSPRRSQPMLCLNCAALSETLLESELFGHEKGAFTGADRMRKGRFELADGGSLLLDEISEISPQIQAKLLRVLQERAFERVGSSSTLHVDVRVIATSNRNLAQAVEREQFRQDLFFRLNVLPVHLPPLRQRTDDIPALAEHFLRHQAERDATPVRSFSMQAIERLQLHGWPGNVRELENICQRAAVMAGEGPISAAMIEPWLAGQRSPDPVTPPAIAGRTLEEIERETIIRTLDRFDGHRQRTAQALGIGVRTLGLKLRKWKDQKLVSQSL